LFSHAKQLLNPSLPHQEDEVHPLFTPPVGGGSLETSSQGLRPLTFPTYPPVRGVRGKGGIKPEGEGEGEADGKKRGKGRFFFF